MLKREPSKLVIEGNQFYIPWVYCVIQDNCIVVDSKSRKLQFKIVCPTYKTLVEDDYLDIYLNKYLILFIRNKVITIESLIFKNRNLI